MIDFTRPKMPAAFQVHEDTSKDGQKTKMSAIQEARKAVRDAVREGRTPDFPDKWGYYKSNFSGAQHGKCGYCEAKILSGQTGDLEHYAPKAEITELRVDRDDQGNEVVHRGQELIDASNVAGRRTVSLCKPGYWFRAYDWQNYLFACERCNTAWKGCLFPVKEQNRTLPPEEGDKETPLLLHPYEDDPLGHFSYDRLGQIEGCTEKGQETINVCGLDRESLRGARHDVAEDIFLAIDEYLNTEDLTCLKPILRKGERSKPFCGMVRAITQKELGITWSDLEKLPLSRG